MKRKSSVHKSGQSNLVRATFSAGIALVVALLAIGLGPGFDLAPRTTAQISNNIASAGAYPVVERNGRQESPFVEVVENHAKAVVNVTATTRNAEAPWWTRGGQLAKSSGSGFFFREDGYILTNNHVIDNAVKITVRTASGYEYEAQLVGGDPLTDLAVLRVEPEEDVTIISFGDSDEIKVGDWAIAIGNPFKEGFDRTVSVGVISAKGRTNLHFGRETPQYQNYIQTDAVINPGNSGGPLLNLQGEAIGVSAAIYSPTGTSVGIGFAIPINLARAIVPDLISDGRASRGWLGVYLSDVSERDARRQGLQAVRGVKIDSVLEDSPADRSGVEHGDIVVEFDNQEVSNASQFSVLVSRVRRGNVVPMTIIREGERFEFTAAVGDRDSWLARTGESQTEQQQRSTTIWGMQIIDYTAEIAEDIGAEFVAGLYVWRVSPGSQADRAGITQGTIIMKVGNEAVASVREFLAAVRAGGSKVRVPVIVQEPDGAIARKIIRR